jgi:hypothetical protein
MLRLTVIAASLLALALPSDPHASSVIAFDRVSAAPNERVKVTSPLGVPLRLYLVRQDAAAAVRTRTDRRLSFIGVVKANSSLAFSLPPLDAGDYGLATWDGTTLRTMAARLRISPTEGCPVTLPNGARPARQPRSVSWYGNGRLWAGLSAGGTYSVPRERVAADGSIGNKLLWVTTPAWAKPTVTGERIDADAPAMGVLRVNTGSFQGDFEPSHMTPVTFPTPGCWRLTARVGDVSLVYVVRVAIRD